MDVLRARVHLSSLNGTRVAVLMKTNACILQHKEVFSLWPQYTRAVPTVLKRPGSVRLQPEAPAASGS